MGNSTSSNAPSVASRYDRWADTNRYIDVDLDDLAEELAFTRSTVSVQDGLIWLAGVASLWFTIVKPVLDLFNFFF
jgi:hypothetical protein